MAGQTDLRARDAGEGGLFDRCVAIAAINPVVADVVLVTEGHRLLQWDVDVSGIGRPENRRGRPTGATDEKDETKDDHPRMDVGAAGENLGHVSGTVLGR